MAEEEAKGKKDKGQYKFLSGKALFTFNPELFEDAEGAIDEENYVDSEEDLTGQEKKIVQKEQIEESKEEVKVDKNLFQEDEAENSEEPDFDD